MACPDPCEVLQCLYEYLGAPVRQTSCDYLVLVSVVCSFEWIHQIGNKAGFRELKASASVWHESTRRQNKMTENKITQLKQTFSGDSEQRHQMQERGKNNGTNQASVD